MKQKFRKAWNRRGKYPRGSVTVEASLLMAVVIPLLTALIYLGFYLHDRAYIQNAVRETAVCMAMEKDVDKDAGKRGVLWIKSLNEDVSVEKDRVVVKAKGSFSVPGLLAGFLADNRLTLDYTVIKPVTDAKKEIQKWRNLEKLAEGS